MAHSTAVPDVRVRGNGFIAAAALLQAEPLLGFVATTGMAVVGGYLAFFHTTRYIVCNVALAIAVGAVCAVQMSLCGDTFVAIVGFWPLMELNSECLLPSTP